MPVSWGTPCWTVSFYLPEEWTNDHGRCQKAGIPQDRRFATKPQLAKHMLARAFAAGIPTQWVTGDSVYGDDRRLRMWLEARPQAYVLAVSGKEYVWVGWQQRQVKTLLATLSEESWTRLSAGDGAKGPRWYDWRWLPLAEPMEPDWRRWLLVRRSVSDPREVRAYVFFAPRPPPWRQWCGWRGPAGSLNSSLKPPRARSA
jgi:SRSO17 transposase